MKAGARSTNERLLDSRKDLVIGVSADSQLITLDVTRNSRQDQLMPPKYRDKRTEAFANGEFVSDFQGFAKQAEKRLEILEAAPTKEALMMLPSNRFEALSGDRNGQYSIRINQKWRICFEWPESEARPFNIEIVDYH